MFQFLTNTFHNFFWKLRTWYPLCWQNTEKVTPRLYLSLILHGNKGPIWSIFVAVVYSECKATQKQVPHSQKVWHTKGFTRQARLKTGTDAFRSAFTMYVFVAYSSKCDCTHRRIHQTMHSHTCRDQQAFWRASENGHRYLQEHKVKRRSI